MKSEQDNALTDPSQVAPPTGMGGGASARRALCQWLLSSGLLAVLTLMMFGDVLFSAAPVVLGAVQGDMNLDYIHWREFGFRELRHGNLALWNPHLFCGAPFFGGTQGALLYPPNVLFLLLPLARALNWSIALHVFLAGAFTYAWAARRGLRPPSCFLSAAIFMFCGAHFSHVYAGHLSNLCSLVWAPLLFLAIDRLSEKPSLSASLPGMFALAMQILAGHPQYVFYTGIAAAIYCSLGWFKQQHKGRFTLGLLAMVGGGLALSAVQVFTALGESHEMLRSSGVPFEFAGMFSFPPENFLTLLAPHFFGNIKTVAYWGRCYLWEMCLFISLGGLVLVMVGAIWGGRRRRFPVLMVLVLLLLALGSHTPLFRLLYDWVPGFNKFRGNSKFIFLASLFLALLAGLGFDELLKGRRLSRVFIGAIGAGGLLLLGAGWLAHPSNTGTAGAAWWHAALVKVYQTNESYLPLKTSSDPAFALDIGGMASLGILIAGATLLVVSLLLWSAWKYRPALWLLLALAVAELFVFGRNSLDSFDLRQAIDPLARQFLESHPGDYRILNHNCPNVALSLGAQDIWGYEPGVVLRYAQLIAFTQGMDPDQAVLLAETLSPNLPEPALAEMLRCRFEFRKENNRLAITEQANYLPHVLLVSRYQLLSGRAQIFNALTNAAFNPGQEVILETPPDPVPVASTDPGSVTLVDWSTDYLTIEAKLFSPAILVIPDVYATGWRVQALAGSAQTRYRVQPADWCLRAVPLSAGRHRLRLEYSPLGFRAGKWVSIVSLCVFLTLAGVAFCRFVRSGGPSPARGEKPQKAL